MSAPLDLDAIRRRINHPLNDLMDLSKAAQADREWNVAAIAALISEVEALRNRVAAIEIERDAADKICASLRAKLEKAKDSFRRIEATCDAESPHSTGTRVRAMADFATEALAELEKP